MNRVVVDPTTVEKLRCVFDQSELCDAAGNVLGRFLPVLRGTEFSSMKPQISEEEIQRRLHEGGGRPLADILADLEARA
jgi:hypothetical protein